MILVSVMYPGGADTTFDHDYYLARHMPLVRERWSPLGLLKSQVVRADAQPDGKPPAFPVMAHLTFESQETFDAAGKAHGREIFSDIKNFTNAKPVTQVSTIVE